MLSIHVFSVFKQQISEEKPRKIDLFPTSSSKTIDPCVTIINECFALVKDEFLVAVDPKSSTLSDINTNNKLLLQELTAGPSKDSTNKRFKSFAWSHPLQALGKYL